MERARKPMEEPRPTVHVVDDDPQVVRMLSAALGAAGMQVEVYADADAFLGAYREREIECLLLDLRLPGTDGLDLQRRLAERAGLLPVVMMTGYASARTAVEAMKLGAVDYIEKPFELQALVRTVQQALQRGREAKLEHQARSEVDGRLARLTAREQEILALIVKGYSSREIAAEIGLAKKTVDLHRSHILAKVGADSVVDLVRMVLTSRRSSDPEAGGDA
jgi:FixJ family two-component response regulator